MYFVFCLVWILGTATYILTLVARREKKVMDQCHRHGAQQVRIGPLAGVWRCLAMFYAITEPPCFPGYGLLYKEYSNYRHAARTPAT